MIPPKRKRTRGGTPVETAAPVEPVPVEPEPPLTNGFTTEQPFLELLRRATKAQLRNCFTRYIDYCCTPAWEADVLSSLCKADGDKTDALLVDLNKLSASLLAKSGSVFLTDGEPSPSLFTYTPTRTERSLILNHSNSGEPPSAEHGTFTKSPLSRDSGVIVTRSHNKVESQDALPVFVAKTELADDVDSSSVPTSEASDSNASSQLAPVSTISSSLSSVVRSHMTKLGLGPSARVTCQLCSRKPRVVLSSLRDHVMTHARLPLYECTYASCMRRFSDRKQLLAHSQNVHRCAVSQHRLDVSPADIAALTSWLEECFPSGHGQDAETQHMSAEEELEEESCEALDKPGHMAKLEEKGASVGDGASFYLHSKNFPDRVSRTCKLCHVMVEMYPYKHVWRHLVHSKALSPYSCLLCSQKYKNESSVKKHLVRNHGQLNHTGCKENEHYAREPDMVEKYRSDYDKFWQKCFGCAFAPPVREPPAIYASFRLSPTMTQPNNNDQAWEADQKQGGLGRLNQVVQRLKTKANCNNGVAKAMVGCLQQHECHICHLKINRKSALPHVWRHLAKRRGLKRGQCLHCLEEITLWSDLSAHLQRSHGVDIPQCDQDFSWKQGELLGPFGAIWKECFRTLPVPNLPTNPPTLQKPALPNGTGKDHRKTTTAAALLVSPPWTNNEPARVPPGSEHSVRCAACFVEFNQQNKRLTELLRYHVWVHVHKSHTVFSCMRCQHAASDGSNMRRHVMRTHGIEQPQRDQDFQDYSEGLRPEASRQWRRCFPGVTPPPSFENTAGFDEDDDDELDEEQDDEELLRILPTRTRNELPTMVPMEAGGGLKLHLSGIGMEDEEPEDQFESIGAWLNSSLDAQLNVVKECAVCGEEVLLSEVAGHVWGHLGVNPTTCAVEGCAYECVDFAQMQEHFETMHSDAESMEYTSCENEYTEQFAQLRERCFSLE